MKVNSNDIQMKFDASSLPRKKNYIQEKVVTYGGKIDYNENVINKPTLNGVEISGDMLEEDPNVKPIGLEDISNMIDSIFD
jgi:hypothetical protein